MFFKNNSSRGEDIIKKETSRTRVFTGKLKIFTDAILLFFALLSIYIVFFSPFDARINRSAFVGLIIANIYILYPITQKSKNLERENHIAINDVICAILSLICYGYIVFNCNQIIEASVRLNTFMVVIGTIGIILTLEACRRATGLPIVIVALFFLIYGLLNNSYKRVIYDVFFTLDGVMGTPIRACSAFISLFVIFGSFLERTGISNFFIQLANSIAGHSIGGPAKVAVISSALCGMVSGSSVGNTVTTGSITIPLMKKNGYKPEFAGAVEAAASTGGQIMPPIMGAAAFLMIEYTNKEYSFIALRACLPALLYFTGIFISVHLEAKKLNLKGIPKENLPKFTNVIKSWYLIIPLVLLTYLIITTTMSFAAIIAIGVSILLSLFNKENRITPKKIIEAFVAGSKSIITVGIACAVAGIIACIITTTGIGTELVSAIVNLSNGNILIAMFLTMITCIILGMGVPTTANYVIMATTCAPILIKLGVNEFASHMFVFYFGIVADITPPVALAAYAGSAIANASPIKTAINATLLAIAAFIVPYIFAMNPALLFINTNAFEVILIVITSIIGIFGVSAGIRGFVFTNMNIIERILIIVGGLLLIYPGLITDLIGIILIALVLVKEYMLLKKSVIK